MAIRVSRIGLQVAGYWQRLGRVVPASPGSIFSSLYRNNWVSNVSIERAWMTDVTMSHSGLAEERWSLRSRPLLTQTTQFTGLSQNDSANLLIHLARQSQHGNPTPIYSDRTKLSSAYSGGSRIFCDASHRRFFPGQRIAIVPTDWGTVSITGVHAPTEYALISSVTDTHIDLEGPLLSSSGYEIGSWIFPLFDSEPVLNIGYDRTTRQIIDGTITWVEKSGLSTIPSLTNSTHVTVPSFSQYDGLPILDSTMNGSIAGRVTREGTTLSSGRASRTSVFGKINRFGIEAEFKMISRLDWWRLASFFDEVKGRMGAFWLVNPQRLWDLVSIQSSTVFRVRKTHYYYVFDPTLSDSTDGKPPWLEWFSIVQDDGTVSISKIASVAEVSQDIWDITVSDSLPITNVSRVTAAHRSRFVEDTMKENWFTLDIVTTKLSMTEVLTEQSISIPNI